MRKLLLLLIILFINCNSLFSQKEGDKKIIVKVTDTSNLYTRIKLAIIKVGFTVRDDMNYHLLTSNIEVKKVLGYTIIKDEINDDTVTIWGMYSNKNKNIYSAEIAPGKYKNIIYFKNNSGAGWDILYSIATEIDPQNLSYSK